MAVSGLERFSFPGNKEVAHARKTMQPDSKLHENTGNFFFFLIFIFCNIALLVLIVNNNVARSSIFLT